ncbi:MAG: efflux RND transporter periplasmic adaptor subunit [Candidatus Krumholzibacteria bacterium]|nr:efflux RND transporter periplasmic adaptor subunit [Candidatus Krumholzibacteria bacterium]
MNTTGRKKKGKGVRILTVVIVAVVALFAIRFWQVSRKETFASIRSVQEAEGKPVEVAEALTGDLEVWTTLAGTVEGSFQYTIVSMNTIRVIEVAKREGEWVEPGDVIIRLEKTAPNPMLHSYNRSRAVYDNALSDAKRMRNLFEEGAISKQALDKAELALEVAKTDLINATESTNLVASHAGVITSVQVEEGEMAEARCPLAWVARTDSVKIVFEAGSLQAMALALGQKAIWHSRGTGKSGEGVISKLDLAADPKSHLLRGEALFPNPNKTLIPGLLVSFRVRTGERYGVVKVPIGCLMESPDGISVYVVEQGEGGKAFARMRDVETALRTSDEVEIVTGLKSGELVVRFGQTRLFDGDPVKVIGGGGRM